MSQFPSLPRGIPNSASARSFVSDLLTPVVKVGVTGLARSGKTVFITALVNCLCAGGALPAFSRLRGIGGFHAYLEPQPDDDIPRFAIESHLEDLINAPPNWPDSTRQISQLRLTFEWNTPLSAERLLRFDFAQRLHVDIIDYPGEWLTDLALLDKDFSAWSRDVLGVVRAEPMETANGPFLKFLDGLDGIATIDEDTAIEGARIYTQFLVDARKRSRAGNVLGPGRFLMPGDLAGTPQLTFFPFVSKTATGSAGPSLLERRFESYKSNLVKPFFEKHFAKLDRQIVLVDALSALNGGALALSELEHGLENVLRAFRPGQNSWLSRLLTRKIGKIVFAATKADHVHASSRKRLEDILKKCISRAAARCEGAGAETVVLALSALRATRDVEKTIDGEVFRCIRGIADQGEVMSRQTFDGLKEVVVFPGDLPVDPLDAFERDWAKASNFNFVKFKPPHLASSEDIATLKAWPHINLDSAFSFLLGDYLP